MHASAQQPLPSAPPVNNPRWGALPRRQLLGALAKACGACEGGAAPEDMLLLAQYSPASYSTNKTELLTELEVRLGRAGLGVGGCVRRVGGLSGGAVCTGVLVAPQQSAGVLLQPGRRTRTSTALALPSCTSRRPFHPTGARERHQGARPWLLRLLQDRAAGIPLPRRRQRPARARQEAGPGGAQVSRGRGRRRGGCVVQVIVMLG